MYIASHEPDAGETEAGNGKPYPTLTSKANAIQKTPDGFTYLDPAKFHELFAADLPRGQAAFEAHSQIPTAAKVFTAAVTDPAWKLTEPTSDPRCPKVALLRDAVATYHPRRASQLRASLPVRKESP